MKIKKNKDGTEKICTEIEMVMTQIKDIHRNGR